jgi:hypothetical protein
MGMEKGAEEKQKLGKHKAERGPRDYGTTGLLTTRPPGSKCRMKNSVRLHQGYIKATSERQQGVLIAT